MKKVIIDNLLSDLSTNQSLLEPLNNLLDESSGVIAESTTNILKFSGKAGGKYFTAISGFNTNAYSVEIFTSLAETNRLANPEFLNSGDKWIIGGGGGVNSGAVHFDGSQTANTALEQSASLQVNALMTGERFSLSVHIHSITAGNIVSVYVGDHLFDPDFDNLDPTADKYRYEGTITTNSNFKIVVSSDFVGTIDTPSLKRIVVFDKELNTPSKWNAEENSSFSGGEVSWDGTQLTNGLIGQYPIVTNSNKHYLVTFTITSVSAGAVYQLQLGTSQRSLNITTNGTYKLFIRPINDIDDNHCTFNLFVDSNFNGTITDIDIVEAEYYQKNFTGNSPRDRNFFYKLDAGSSAQPGSSTEIEATFTAPAGANAFLGIFSIGEVTELDCPEYGLQLEMVNNEVSIPYADASRYRRFRSPQKVYSGQLALKTATKTIEKIREILRTKGSKPMAWVLAPYRCKDTIIWGGMHENTQTFTSYDRDTLDFSIKEEL